MQMRRHRKRLLRCVLVRLWSCLYWNSLYLNGNFNGIMLIPCQQSQDIFWFFYSLWLKVFDFDMLFVLFAKLVEFWWEKYFAFFLIFYFCLTVTIWSKWHQVFYMGGENFNEPFKYILHLANIFKIFICFFSFLNLGCKKGIVKAESTTCTIATCGSWAQITSD